MGCGVLTWPLRQYLAAEAFCLNRASVPWQPRPVGFLILDFECYKEDVNLDLVNKVPVDISEFCVTGLF